MTKRMPSRHPMLLTNPRSLKATKRSVQKSILWIKMRTMQKACRKKMVGRLARINRKRMRKKRTRYQHQIPHKTLTTPLRKSRKVPLKISNLRTQARPNLSRNKIAPTLHLQKSRRNRNRILTSPCRKLLSAGKNDWKLWNKSPQKRAKITRLRKMIMQKKNWMVLWNMFRKKKVRTLPSWHPTQRWTRSTFPSCKRTKKRKSWTRTLTKSSKMMKR
mmetsp:Transcript_7969/g.15218  ORF Transcript_7969/g.15218 Transcript_7969/m.15218 type:complete len:217 (+) Transcript_7969:1612-2262(+)